MTKLVTLGVVGEMGEGAMEEGMTKAVAIEGEPMSSRLRWLIALVVRVVSVREMGEVYVNDITQMAGMNLSGAQHAVAGIVVTVKNLCSSSFRNLAS